MCVCVFVLGLPQDSERVCVCVCVGGTLLSWRVGHSVSALGNEQSSWGR